jgi:hypothetical protein
MNEHERDADWQLYLRRQKVDPLELAELLAADWCDCEFCRLCREAK